MKLPDLLGTTFVEKNAGACPGTHSPSLLHNTCTQTIQHIRRESACTQANERTSDHRVHNFHNFHNCHSCHDWHEPKSPVLLGTTFVEKERRCLSRHSPSLFHTTHNAYRQTQRKKERERARKTRVSERAFTQKFTTVTPRHLC